MLFNPYEIFKVNNKTEFNEFALKIFHFQYQNNKVYRQFVDYLYHSDNKKVRSIQHYTEIPFLPIEFFKTHDIICFPLYSGNLYFESSGTSKQNLSKHYIADIHLYETSVLKAFEYFYGHPEQYLFIFLLPDINERIHSSLVYMANYLMSFSRYKESGFYLSDFNKAKIIIEKNADKESKIFILGVSYALMDFAETGIKLNEKVIVMETGGMKGKREELPKNFLHNYLKDKFEVSEIHSEYGMTELFSQAYSEGNGIFQTPKWMKVLVRDAEDPLNVHVGNKQGIINVIDLANIYTCSFIATSDIGKIINDDKFELLGRSDFSDIRGCNLMYQ